jgi:hypothetical protein
VHPFTHRFFDPSPERHASAMKADPDCFRGYLKNFARLDCAQSVNLPQHENDPQEKAIGAWR